MQRSDTLLQAIYRLYEHSGITLASAVAFSVILSIFPFCIFLGSIAGVFGGRELAEQAVLLMVDVLPAPVAEALAPEVRNVMGQSRFDLLTFSAAFALIFAMGAIETLREALNVAYRTPENRTYPTCLAVSAAFVFVGALSLLLLTAGLVVWPAIVARLEPSWLARSEAGWVRSLLNSTLLSGGVRYAVAGGVIAIQLIAMHLWLAAGRRTLAEIWPGILLSVVLWLLTAMLFATYLDFNDYARFYAGLSQLMAALIFFWVSAVIVLLGAELNRGLLEFRRMRDGEAA
jgi:membrane protein